MMLSPVSESGDTTQQAAQAQRGLASRIMRAMSAQMATQALRIVQQILLIPLFLKAWGVDVYNDWLLISAGISLVGIFDAGMQPYFSGLLQERLVQGDVAGYRRAARVAGFNYSIIILGALAAAAIMSLVVDWRAVLGVGVLDDDATYTTLALLGANALVTLPFGVAGSVYKAHAEYDRGVLVNVGNSMVQILVPALLLILKQPVVVLAAGTIFASLIGWIGVTVDQRVRYGPLPWGWTVPTIAELRAAATQGLFFTASPIATWATIQGPILILGHLGNPAATVSFTMARTLVGVSRQLTLQMAYPFGFELSVLMLRREMAALAGLLSNAVSALAIIGGVLSGLIVVAGPPIGVLWLRGRVAIEPALILALAIPIAIGASAQLYQLVLVFSNRPRLIASSSIGYATLGLMLSLALAPRFGAIGVAAGLGIGEVVAMVIYLPSRTLRMIGITGYAMQRTSLLRTALAAGLSYVVARIAASVIPPTGFLALIAFLSAWAVATIAFILAFLLNANQRSLILGLLILKKPLKR